MKGIDVYIQVEGVVDLNHVKGIDEKSLIKKFIGFSTKNNLNILLTEIKLSRYCHLNSS